MFIIRSTIENSQSTKEFEKKQNLILAVKILNFLKIKRKNKTLLITIIILTFVKSRIVQCFINFKTKINFVSQFLIKNIQLKKNIVANELIEIINKYIIRIYDKHIFDIFINDSQKMFENFKCEFYVVNMQSYNIILSYL